MLQAVCLKKFRNKNNQIIGYRIQDKNGNTVDVKPEQLKQAIKNKQISVLNLTLTSDNKLIDTKISNKTAQVSASNTIVPFIDTKKLIMELRNHLKYNGWDDKVKLVSDDSNKLYSHYEDTSYKYHKYGWDFGNFPILNSMIDRGKLICLFEIDISNDYKDNQTELAFFYDVNNRATVFSVFSMEEGCTILDGDEKLCIAFGEGNHSESLAIKKIVDICVEFLVFKADSVIINWHNYIKGVLPEYHRKF